MNPTRADVRIDPISGREVVIVGSRQGRPNLPSDGCPFCPGGREAPEPYDVLWFPNRWPAMPGERCEVILYTPDHHAAFWQMGAAQAEKVVDLWADRTAALGARDDVACVLPFENRGPEVGATIAHPHGQIYAFDEVPPVLRDEARSGVTPDPAGVAPERVVADAGNWAAWVPEAAWWPYELICAPTVDVADLSDPRLDRPSVAHLLVDVLERLDFLFPAGSAARSGPHADPAGPPPEPSPMPYMMWWHQRPCDGGNWSGVRLHLHIAPLLRSPSTQRFVAAAELGAGVYFNPVDPLQAAGELREAVTR